LRFAVGVDAAPRIGEAIGFGGYVRDSAMHRI